MSAGPCYIHGFSGTQKKHRKSQHFKSGFKKKLVINHPENNDLEIDQTRKERLKRIKRNELFKRLIFLPVMIGFLFILCFYFHFIGFSPFNPETGVEQYSLQELEKTRIENELKTAFTYHLNKGKNNYKIGHFDTAQYDYQLALKIKPNDYTANLGLVETLMKKCETEGLLCAEAEGYEKMIRSVHQIKIEKQSLKVRSK